MAWQPVAHSDTGAASMVDSNEYMYMALHFASGNSAPSVSRGRHQAIGSLWGLLNCSLN